MGVVKPARAGGCALALWVLITPIAAFAQTELRTELSEALGRFRPVEARLTLELGYAPFAPGARASSADGVRLALVAARIADAAAREPTSQNLQLLGLLQLLERRPSAAVATLERAIRPSAADSGLASDLAASYMARARSNDDPHDLLLALETLEGALRGDASYVPARFNRALVLDGLHLVIASRQAWEEYRTLDPASPWSAEARSHLDELEAPTLLERWAAERPRFEALLREDHADAARSLAARFLPAARTWAQDELFSAWAQALVQGRREEAAWNLRVLLVLGQLLEERHQDTLVLEAARAIADSDPARGAGLAAAHLELQAGARLFAQQRYTDAAPRFAEAQRLLQEGGSPFAAVAAFDRARCRFYAGDPRGSDEILQQLDAMTVHWPNLRAQVLRCLALLRHLAGDLGEALRLGLAAEKLLLTTEDEQWLSHTRGLLASTLARLGEGDRAWRYRWLSLGGARAPRGSVQRGNVLLDAARALRAEGHRLAALALQNELVPLTNADSPESQTAALLERARTLESLGLSDDAMADIHTAHQRAARVAEAGVRERAEASIGLVEGAALARKRPPEARRLLETSLGRFQRLGFRAEAAAIHTAIAESWAAEGQDERAAEAFARAAAEAEQDSGRLLDDRLRISHRDAVRAIFDRLVDFHLRRGAPPAAFAWAERGRARALLDALAALGSTSGGGGPQPLEIAAIAKSIPAGTLVLEYAVLSDRIVVWAIRHGAVETVEAPVTESVLREEVRTLRRVLEEGSGENEVRPHAARLFDRILRPVAHLLAPGTRLVMVPHKILSEVPFSVLTDRETGRYLIQDHVVVVAPSASAYVRVRGTAAPEGPEGSVLVAGHAGEQWQTLLGLEPLQEAEDEARRIAQLYKRPTLLLGAAATPRRVLAELPFHRIFHFSGHAVANEVEPALSYLALASEEVDRRSSHALFARDISQADLRATRLVVLSGCRTARAAVSESEGLLGLARFFLAAGVPTVVGSLWAVDDRAAAELMVFLHEELRAGVDPGAALRAAQLRLQAQGGRDSFPPLSWSAFMAVETAGNGPSN